MKERMKQRINLYVIIFILLISTILQFVLVFNNSVWGDEAYTTSIVSQDWAELWNSIVSDVHPPLYYIILKLVTIVLGNKLIVMKIFSLLPIVLMNIIVAVFVLKNERINKDLNTSILFSIFAIATLLTTNFLDMGQQLRMYSLATLFVTISGIFAYRLFRNRSKTNIIIFICASLAAALTHYFALIMEIIIYAYLFIALFIKDRKNLKKIGIITLITIIGYLWWLPFGISQFIKVKNNFWVTFNLKDILKYIKNILGGDTICSCIGLCIIGILVCYVIYKLVKKQFNNQEKEEVIFALCSISIVIVTIIIGTILNIVIRPIFITRYMFPSLGLFWIGIIVLLKNIKLKKFFIPLISIYLLCIVILEYPKAYKKELQTRNK